MAEPPDKELIEELKRTRRRDRWRAFLRPLITLASIVISIGLLMFIMKSCQEHRPSPFLQPSSSPPPTHSRRMTAINPLSRWAALRQPILCRASYLAARH
jgi:hypothetical protein